MTPSAAMLATGLLASACTSTVRSARTEDQARDMVPVPICLERMPRGGAGEVVSLTDEEYWSLVLPGFDAALGTLDERSQDCSGQPLPVALGSTSDVHAARRFGKAVISPAADGMKIVWLPSHQSNSGPALGLLSLSRVVDSYFEVYALGLHQGRAEGTHFGVERMGTAIALTATEERCEDATSRARCRVSVTVYGLGGGRLHALGAFVTREFGTLSGDSAGLEISFSASVDFQADALVLSEQLTTVDPAGGQLQSSELERRLVIEGDRLVPSAPSLWAPYASETDHSTRL